MRPIKFIVIHCSATPNGRPTSVQEIDSWHRKRGWNGIGYHRVIGVNGEVDLGRPLEVIGAHVEGANSNSIGVCMIGLDKYSKAQWEALQALVDWLLTQFPNAKVLGHRDFSPDKDGDGIIEPWEWTKTCPGFDVSAWLEGGKVPLEGHIL